MRGKLFLNSDGIRTPLPTRFSKPKTSVTYPEEELDYSSYALVAWRPFKEMTLAKEAKRAFCFLANGTFGPI